MGADHFSAAARIEVRYFGNIDHKSPYARLKLVQHMFAKADKRPVVNHSAGDLDEIDLVSHFRGNLHAPTVFPDSNSCQDSLRSQSAFRVGLINATFAEQGNYFVRAELSANGQGHEFGGDYKTTKVSGRITAISRRQLCGDATTQFGFYVNPRVARPGAEMRIGQATGVL